MRFQLKVMLSRFSHDFYLNKADKKFYFKMHHDGEKRKLLKKNFNIKTFNKNNFRKKLFSLWLCAQQKRRRIRRNRLLHFKI